ncbi:MAG: ASCH domain-containing protein [Actinobacteria bacterium]|nr:ASCH domain-containing protein [Actinomycetota bacterium]
MILFKPEHKDMILAGKKTQTRRVGKKRWKVGSIHQARLNYYSEPFARLKITGVRRELLGWITNEDAEKEGYSCIAEYKQVFRRIYGFWDDMQEVWVIDFEVVKDGNN